MSCRTPIGAIRCRADVNPAHDPDQTLGSVAKRADNGISRAADQRKKENPSRRVVDVSRSRPHVCVYFLTRRSDLRISILGDVRTGADLVRVAPSPAAREDFQSNGTVPTLVTHNRFVSNKPGRHQRTASPATVRRVSSRRARAGTFAVTSGVYSLGRLGSSGRMNVRS
jgi:hypothetical protein